MFLKSDVNIVEQVVYI